jgi:hypothetical protein
MVETGKEAGAEMTMETAKETVEVVLRVRSKCFHKQPLTKIKSRWAPSGTNPSYLVGNITACWSPSSRFDRLK